MLDGNVVLSEAHYRPGQLAGVVDDFDEPAAGCVVVVTVVDLAWCERAATLLPARALGAGLEWVASTMSVTALLGEVKDSTRRVCELVAAVRSYSQLDRGSVRVIDVTDGIDSTLVMPGHKLHDVRVVRRYGPDVPRVEASAGELNQVWTNLMDDAVDAMDGAGTLRVTTRADGDQVVVDIVDTGPGMPSHVAARVRGLLRHQGRGQGHGARPRHRPTHRGRAPWRHDLRAGTR